MRKRLLLVLTILLLTGAFALPAAAQTSPQMSYRSQPDSVYVFINDIAYVEDQLELPGGTAIEVALPAETFVDTLIVRENDGRVPQYRVKYEGGRVLVSWTTPPSDDVRQISLTYLMSGISWRPTYDMVINDDENVTFDFFSEITDRALTLENVAVWLVNGYVDTSQALNQQTNLTANQYIAGYEEDKFDGAITAGYTSIQHVYPLEAITALPGETLFVQMLSADLPARRLDFWNASSSNQVDVIYKVRNTTEIPFAEGIVRSYRDGLFLGADFVEQTPPGSEGSITVGALQNVRVRKAETRTQIENRNSDYRHTVTLTLSNFDADPVTIEVVDSYPSSLISAEFQDQPEEQAGNLWRWTFTIQPGETFETMYVFETD